MQRPDTYQSFGHASGEKVTLWVYISGRLETREGVGSDDHDAWWDMSAVLAYGRVRGKDGSLVVESRNTGRQRRLAEAVVREFSGVKFWVWGRGWRGAKGMQEWWSHVSGGDMTWDGGRRATV